MLYGKLKRYMLRFLKEKLAENLYYHDLGHTLEVLNNISEISRYEKVTKYELVLLKTAALLHDSGFTLKYQDHESESQKLAREILPQFKYTYVEINTICNLIEVTRIPQKPTNLMERIISDADLLYLGTDRFVDTAEKLFQELKFYSLISTRKQWNKIQKDFLNVHHFHTEYCIENYNLPKAENLQKVIEELNNPN